MAFKGKRLTFHGAFKSKAKAKQAEKSCPCFILTRKVKGKTRHIVAEKKG